MGCIQLCAIQTVCCHVIADHCRPAAAAAAAATAATAVHIRQCGILLPWQLHDEKDTQRGCWRGR
jgi:hypothetical protein